MSRRRRAVKREILPDAKFGDIVITRFMNALMYDGKKSDRRDDRLQRAGRAEEARRRRLATRCACSTRRWTT